MRIVLPLWIIAGEKKMDSFNILNNTTSEDEREINEMNLRNPQFSRPISWDWFEKQDWTVEDWWWKNKGSKKKWIKASDK